MLDKDLKLWYIEANKKPQMFASLVSVDNFHKQLIGDMLDITFALLRSRLSRIRHFMADFIHSHLLSGRPYDKDALRQKFFQINKDRIDPEFEVDSENTWQLIIDENLPKEQGYFGTLNASCFE